MIPLCRLLAIVDGMGISPVEAGYLITGRKNNG